SLKRRERPAGAPGSAPALLKMTVGFDHTEPKGLRAMGILRARRTVLIGGMLALYIALTAGVALADAAPPPPDLAQRVADLEAYVTNGTPKALASSGPGHNAWMMTSSALVLFMTLPGLALFYGGLVRRKNLLSVMAQCLGCAGLVTILWWAVGYTLVFASGTP